MRIIQVTDSILSFGYVDGTVRHHLYVLAMKESLILLSEHIRDPGLARIEIVTELLHIVGFAALFHHGTSFPLSGKGIQRTAGKYSSGLHVIFHIIRAELHIVIFNGDVTVIEYAPFPSGKILHY